jgi:DNA polymerase/3'-5' exonuclease PolX
VRAIFDEKGTAGLEALPHVGRGIAAAIAEMLITGHWSQLERLRGTVDAVQLFRTVPGIGPGLAERIHDELHLDTLEAAAGTSRPCTPIPRRRTGSERCGTGS